MKNKTLQKLGILAVSMIVGTIAAINGNIATIAQSFPDVPLSTVELISTIPSFALIISVLTSGKIAEVLSPRRTVLLGVALAAVSGIVPCFISNIYVVLLSRAVFGFGTGLFNSLLVTFINTLFHEEERTQMIGFHAAVGSGGGIIITFVSGQLLQFGWQVSFAAYAVSFISFLLFFLFVPSIQLPSANKNTANEGNGSFTKLLPWLLLIFAAMLCYMTFGVKISTLIKESGYGSSSTGSYVIMALCVGALISGTLFSKLVKIFDRYLLAVGFGIDAIAMFLLAISTSSFLTILAGFIAGLGNSIMVPYILNRIPSMHLKNTVLASSLVYVAYNLGNALAPYGAIVLQFISPFAGVRGLFMTLACMFILYAVIMIAYGFKGNKSNA